MLQSGKQSCTLWQLDAAVSENGRIDLEFLSKNGYSIGARARKRLREPDMKPDQGGARRKFDDAELLACAQEVLAKHSKAGSKVVRAQKTDQGWRKVRGQGSGAETVPSESLLAAPGTIYSSEPALQQQMLVVTFRKMVREHFGNYRLGSRKTDMCSHCTTFHSKVVPAFQRLLTQVRAVFLVPVQDVLRRFLHLAREALTLKCGLFHSQQP